MKNFYMVEEHDKVKDLNRIHNNIMPHLGYNSSSNTQDKEHIIKGIGDLIPLKTRCLLSWGKTKGC